MAAPDAQMVEAIAIEPIMSGGKRYEPGAALMLGAAEYEQLAAMGHVSAAAGAVARIKSGAETLVKAAAKVIKPGRASS